MTDRELLELAAKAAGHESKWDQPRGATHGTLRIRSGDRWSVWNPLTDDGDALRLAVKLRLDLMPGERDQEASTRNYFIQALEPDGDDPCAALRRAIVRAAAEIGKNMGDA